MNEYWIYSERYIDPSLPEGQGEGGDEGDVVKAVGVELSVSRFGSVLGDPGSVGGIYIKQWDAGYKLFDSTNENW